METRALWTAAALQRYAEFEYAWAREYADKGDVDGFNRHMQEGAEYAHMARYIMGIDE